MDSESGCLKNYVDFSKLLYENRLHIIVEKSAYHNNIICHINARLQPRVQNIFHWVGLMGYLS